MRADQNPAPLAFSNMVVALGLHYYDFVKTKVEKPAEQEEPEEASTETFVEGRLVQVLPEPPTVSVVAKDDFETRMLKVMRLQQNIDVYLKQLGDIVIAVEKLRDELAELR